MTVPFDDLELICTLINVLPTPWCDMQEFDDSSGYRLVIESIDDECEYCTLVRRAGMGLDVNIPAELDGTHWATEIESAAKWRGYDVLRQPPKLVECEAANG